MLGYPFLKLVDDKQRKEEFAKFLRGHASTYGSGTENYANCIKEAKKYEREAHNLEQKIKNYNNLYK